MAEEPLDLRVGIDTRIVATDGTRSFLEQGLGRTRFDAEHDGLRLGEAYVSARYRLSDAVTVRGDVMTFGDGYGASLDVTQLYLQFRPFPTGSVRFSSRVGVFYPEFSMENRGAAWTSAYTLTPSAINSWFGEELRAIGLETDVRWLGASSGYQGDIGLIVGIYGWNDPIGAQVATRGWALHDRQTGLFGYLPTLEAAGGKIYEFREIDDRPGYYVGMQWRHGDHFDLRAFRYDNRADPAAFAHEFAWLTRFYAVGARVEAGTHWTFVSQILTGETYVGPRDTWGAEWKMDAWFALGSYQRGQWRWSARYDAFRTEQTAGTPAVDDDGNAVTLCAQWSLSRAWSVALEGLRIKSDSTARAVVGLAPRQSDKLLQLAIRYQGHR